MSLHPRAEELLDYWFSGSQDERSARWWQKNEETDRLIEERFGDLVDRAAAGAFDDWSSTARGALALVLVLDQIPRTIFRGSPRSWAYDAKAREVMTDALERRLDHDLTTHDEVCFLVMPLMHSERLADQDRAIRVFASLVERFGTGEGNLKYAHAHRDVIAEHGRFPHRNAVLGRPNTPAEEEYLSQDGAGF